MGISEKKMQIVINNYFKQECDINTSIRGAFEKGFRIGVKKGQSAQPETQWIPVSERLPEKGGEYLVSVHHTIGAISVFHPEKDTYVDDVAIMKYYGKFPSTVRAWMPLPEAYKSNK